MLLYPSINPIEKTKHPVSFADISNKKKFLKTPVAIFMKEIMPRVVWNSYVKCFMKLTLEDVKKKTDKDFIVVTDWFKENSEIYQMIAEDPTTSIVFRYLYQNDNPPCCIDNIFPWGKAAFQIHRRQQAIIKYNVILYSRMLETMERLRIISLCCGPGSNVLAAIRQLSPNQQKRIDFVGIDTDSWAIDGGNKLARDYGLLCSVNFIQADARDFAKMDLGKFDVVDFIGTLCTKERIVKVGALMLFSPLLSEKGVLMTSIPRHKMIEEDPITDSIMRFNSWEIIYETVEEILKIINEAGMKLSKNFEGLPSCFIEGDGYPLYLIDEDGVPLHFEGEEGHHIMTVMSRK